MILLTLLYIPNNAGPIFILALSTCIPWLATPFHPIHKGTSYLLQNERERRRETDETEGFVGQQRQVELSKKKRQVECKLY